MLRLRTLRNVYNIKLSKYFTTNGGDGFPPKTTETELKLPDEPTNCCMSGCENCVWIMYAKDLTDMYKDSGETAKKVILKKIQDPSMQIFLKLELDQIDQKKSLLETIQTKPPKNKKK